MPRLKKPVRNKAEYKQYYDLIFRGYGKDDKIKRKEGEQLKDFEKVSSSDDLFGVFKDNIVMIDADDMKTAETISKMLKHMNIKFYYQNTVRGKHFFFNKDKYSTILKNGTAVKTAVGLEVDYKCHFNDGTKLSKTLSDGTVQPRPILGNGLQEIPFWLLPIKTDKELVGLLEGQGRNETLYPYILTLCRYGFGKDEIKTTIRLIDKFVFGKSLGKELEVILRNEAFPSNNEIFIYAQPGSRSPTLDYELFAKHMIDYFKISKINDMIYILKNDIYVKMTDDELDFAIMDIIKNSKTHQRREVKPYIKKYAPQKTIESNSLILFNNGVYCVNTKELLPINENYVFFNKIKSNYIKNPVKQPLVDTFLDDISCGDETIKKLIIQMVAYSLMRGNIYQVFFFLDGPGKNGKSVLFDFIQYCFGYENVSNLSIQNLNDRFGVGAIRDKLINIGDDVPQNFIGDTSNIKKAVSGETMFVEDKNKDKEPLKYDGKLIFSGNGIPKFSDKSEGLLRRLIIIPMRAKFIDGKNRDVKLKEKLLTKDNAEYFISLCVQELHEVLTHGFVKCNAAEEAKTEFELSNNNIMEFIIEHEIENNTTANVYLKYNTWCRENGYTDIFGRNTFISILKEHGYDKRQIILNGKKQWVFYKKQEK